MLKVLFFVLALCLVAHAIPVERRTPVDLTDPVPLPEGWSRISAKPVTTQSDRKVELLFAIKHRNLDVLEETFWAVSDPENKRYGQHLSLEQLTDLVGPTQQTVDDVIFWLKSNGVHDAFVTQGREYIHATVSVPTAARLFDITFHTYKHKSGQTFDATLGPYTVPSSIAENLDLVSGLVGFPDIDFKPKIRVPSADAPEVAPITPAIIRARYNVTDNIETSNPQNARAVAEFQAQYYAPSDLKKFWNKYVKNAPFQPVAKVIGYNDPTGPGIEASLDIEYIMGVVPNITTWFYSMKQFNFWNDLVRWTGELSNETNPPLVHSVSYGEQGDYPSISYRDRLNADFMKLGARGLSIVFASGDSGAGCGDGTVFTPGACDCSFFPSFPATCPYTTSVGATGFINGNSGPEHAVSAFKSGGGFSLIFPTTTEQASAVAAYFASGVRLPEACAYNASGRGTPDVSALGDIAFQVINGGQDIPVGGTSASAPTFSSIISLLNEQRLNANKSPLGFLNPWIYQTAKSSTGAFWDVTAGDNTTPQCCAGGKLGGFDCAAGWDPVTGVGTPNYVVLKQNV